MGDGADLQRAKRHVLDFHRAIDEATDDALVDAVQRTTSPSCVFNATYPFADGLDALGYAHSVWAPLQRSFAPMQRRQDIFFAGTNDLDGGATTWVVSMGHLLGLFDQPFCGVRPTRQATMLRYCEFYSVATEGITEVTLFLDVLNFMALASAEVMVPSTAATLVTPGPRTHDGLLFHGAPPAEGLKTLRLFQRMINRLLEADVDTRQTPLDADWTPDMIWWGPGGIGAPYTQERYLEQHAIPFSEGLEWGTF
ncbi:MAG: nuclear transport factor 2 family protein, partial [Pseudomonadota bacterium]